MFSIYDLHGQKVKRHDLQVHKHGRWDDSINMAAQWPSLHAANPPKMPNTTTSNIVESKTVKDRLMLTNFLAANKNSSDGGAGARLMNGSNSNSENAAAAARGDEGKQQRTANNSAISSNDGENRVIACEQGSWCSGKKCNNRFAYLFCSINKTLEKYQPENEYQLGGRSSIATQEWGYKSPFFCIIYEAVF